MNGMEKAAFEMELRKKIFEEEQERKRAYKRQWQEKNREHIAQYNRAYRIRRKLCKEVEHNEQSD